MNRPNFFRSALAILLCLTMVLSFVPMQVMAEEVVPQAAHDCAKDGHAYKAKEISGSCIQYPRTQFTCTYCGDSYDVYPDSLYSDWQTEEPDVDQSLIQSQTQYRTSQYETMTSYNTAVDGYERIGSQWSKIDTRTVAYVASWPAGFDRTNSLFKQYDKIAMKVSASESENRKTEINSEGIVGYIYYHWCYEGYPYTVDTQTDTFNRFHAYYSTKAPSEANSYDSSDNSYRFDDSTACSDSKWYFCVPVYEQTYTNYRLEYIYGTWSNFSEWSETEATPSETVKVGTRTVYRYLNGPKGEHAYSRESYPAGCVGVGKVIYRCGLCGDSYTDYPVGTGHYFENGKCTFCNSDEPNYYLFGYINGKNYACEEDAANLGEYKFVDGKLVVTFESDSYIGVKTDDGMWYMPERYTTSDGALMINTQTGASEKMFVPGGVELTFTLAYIGNQYAGAGDMIALNYVGGECSHRYLADVITEATCTEAGELEYTCSKCYDSYRGVMEPWGHDFRRGTCKRCGLVDESYETPNYYLVGYINGVDYGSQDDYENRGEFRFEEGKLVLNCSQDSYVFVKAEGNTAWYMTQDYCTGTSAVLYDTREGAHEKMFIPAHMEVTFTLRESENNTLVLSYEAVPCKHIFDDTVLVAPDCENDGIILRTCRVCTATAEKPSVALGHEYKSYTTEPGCLTSGYTTYKCQRCIHSYVDNEVPPTGHNYGAQILEETGCETDGTMIYICKLCGDSYTSKIPAVGHSYIAKVTKPTCEDKGYTTYTCIGCGDSYNADAVPPLEHDYVGVMTKIPTCETAGQMTYTCTRCGDAYLQNQDALGHNFVSKVVPATCAVTGGTYHCCALCGYTYSNNMVEAPGHKYANGKCTVCGEAEGPGYFLFGYINGKNYGCEEDYMFMGTYRFQNGKLVATFKEDSYIGIKTERNGAWYMTEKYVDGSTGTFKNTSTGAGEKMFVPGGVEVTFTLTVNSDDTLTLSYTTTPCDHTYYSNVTTQPTCEADGLRTFFCSKCGASHTEAIVIGGHSYKAVITKPTCAAQGYTTYTCLVCGDSYTDNIVPENGHIMKTQITQKPGCVTYGLVSYRCEICDFGYTEELEPTGHKYKAVKTKPTCDYPGYTTRICVVCEDSYKDNEVPALGHNFVAVERVEPTCEGFGYLTHVCQNCDQIYVERLKPAGHSFVEGYCSVCGKSEQCEHIWQNGICCYCSAVCEHQFVYGVCSVCSMEDPSYVPNFYLVGYINGANYGCEEDYENMGQYKFVDNQLAVKFTQDSYVFLKTEGNTDWYMTKGYTENSTAIFYNTATGSNEKMFVPGGMQLLFTLESIGDDEFQLTYVGLPCDHYYEETEYVKPVCPKDGYKIFTCSKCNDRYFEFYSVEDHVYNADGFCTCGARDPQKGAYVKVTDMDRATAGGQYILAVMDHGDGWQAMSNTLTDGKLAGKHVIYGDSKVCGEKMPVWTLESMEGGFSLRMGDEYLAYDADTNFKLQDTPYAWTLEDGYILTSATENRGIYYHLTNNNYGVYSDSEAVGGDYVAALELYRYESKVPVCNHIFVNGCCAVCDYFADDYYLVGYINGANHGCEEDYENMGNYRFENFKLTTTFEQDSYVFIKQEANLNWYMTQAYSDGTTAIFYPTSTGAEEKMFVPGGVEITFELIPNQDGSFTLRYTTAASVKPILTPKVPTLEFKDMVCIRAYFTAENTQDVLEMGMLTYSSQVTSANIETADYVIPGADYNASVGRYVASSHGIAAKYLGDTVYMAIYAKLADGTYAYSKVVNYSPLTYAHNQLKNSTDMKLKQLVVSMLLYGAEAQKFFQHNVENLASASLTEEYKNIPEAYRADMVATVPTAPAAKQGAFTYNKGYSQRVPSISFDGAFAINYYFTPKYAPVDGITMYYWSEADYNKADVLTVENATGSMKMEGTGTARYWAQISGIAAKNLSEAVYVAGVYSDGTTTWSTGVLGYSIGTYSVSQAAKGGDVAALAMATAVYGYHAKQYFG